MMIFLESLTFASLLLTWSNPWIISSNSTTSMSASSNRTCSMCGVTVQGELQKFMELQEAGLKTDFRCTECRRWSGQEKLSLRQEAEQQLIRESVSIDDEEGVALAKLQFILPPEENLKNNRNIALGMLNGVLWSIVKISRWEKPIPNQEGSLKS